MLRTFSTIVCVAVAIANEPPAPEQTVPGQKFLAKKEESDTKKASATDTEKASATEVEKTVAVSQAETSVVSADGTQVETKAKPNSDATSTSITVKPGTKIEVTVENKDGVTTTKLRDSSGAQTTTLTNTESKQVPLTEDIKQNGDIVSVPVPTHDPEPEEEVSYIAKFVTWAFMLKLAAIISNIITQLSPLRIIGEVRVNKSTGSQDSLPFLMIAVCGAQWCFYGLFAWWVTSNQGFVIVVYANVLGVVLGSWYTWSFMKYCIDSQRAGALQLYLIAAVVLAVFQICVLGVFKPEKSLLITGCVAAVMSVLVQTFFSFSEAILLENTSKTSKVDVTRMPKRKFLSKKVTASPLFDLHTVFATRSTKCWPGDLIVASFVSNCLWICCTLFNQICINFTFLKCFETVSIEICQN